MLWLSKWEELDVRIICDNELTKKIFTSTWSDDAHSTLQMQSSMHGYIYKDLHLICYLQDQKYTL